METMKATRTQRPGLATAAATARRGVVTARLGEGRVEVRVAGVLLQVTAQGTLTPGQVVLVLDWAGGAMALPLAGMDPTQAGEVVVHHG